MKKTILFLTILFFISNTFAVTSITHEGINTGDYFVNQADLNIILNGPIDDLNYLGGLLNGQELNKVFFNDFPILGAELISTDDKNYIKTNIVLENPFIVGKNSLEYFVVKNNGTKITGNNFYFYFDNIEPKIESLRVNEGTSTSNWSNKKTPTFVLDLNKEGHYFNGGEIYFSCNNSNNNDWNSFQLTWISSDKNNNEFTGFDITKGVDCNTSSGKKTIYVKVEDWNGRQSKSKSVSYWYDGTKPNKPANVEATAGNTEVKLEWEKPVDNTVSGIKGYEISYRRGTGTWTTIEVIGENTKTKTIENLTNDSEYTFQIKTVSKAGNKSDEVEIKRTPRAPELDSGITVRRDGERVSYVKDEDEIRIRCDIEERSDEVELRYYYDNDFSKNLTGPRDNRDYAEATIEVERNHERITFICTWKYDGAEYEERKEIIIDNEPPRIEWGELEEELEGIVEVYANITDNKGVDTTSIKFEIEGTTKSHTRTGAKYHFDLDTREYENGEYTLKIIAYDLAGNKTERTKLITIHNELPDEEKAIARAEREKQTVEDLIKYYTDRGIEVGEGIREEKGEANALLEEARQAVDKEYRKTKAEEAEQKYLEILEKLESEQKGETQTYEYEDKELGRILANIGLPVDRIEEAEQKIREGNITRRARIYKIGEEYVLQIEITHELEEETIILEILPNEFLRKLGEMNSNLDFQRKGTLPIIEATVPEGTQKIYYTIKLSEQEANKIIEEGIIQKYVAPPIMLSGEEEIIIENNLITFLLTIGIIILVIACIIIGIGIMVKKKPEIRQIKPLQELKQKMTKKPKKKRWEYK